MCFFCGCEIFLGGNAFVWIITTRFCYLAPLQKSGFLNLQCKFLLSGNLSQPSWTGSRIISPDQDALVQVNVSKPSVSVKEMWIRRVGSVQPRFQPLPVSNGTLLTPLRHLGTLVVVQAPGSSPPGAYLLPDSCSHFSSCEFFRLPKTIPASSL